MPRDLQEQIAQTLHQFEALVEEALSGWAGARDPVAFREMELTVARATRSLADEIVAAVLRESLADPSFQAQTSEAARSSRRLRNGGRREVTVRLLGGGRVGVPTEYLRPNRRGRIGRPRKTRGKGGAGLYPALAALGISFGVTPALGAEVCRQVADSDSVRAGRAALARRDIDLGHKQTLRIVRCFGSRGLLRRQCRSYAVRRIREGQDPTRQRCNRERHPPRRQSAMKGNGSFWLEANAEIVLLLRSYLKTGRIDALFDWSIASAAPWWKPELAPSLLEQPKSAA